MAFESYVQPGHGAEEQRDTYWLTVDANRIEFRSHPVQDKPSDYDPARTGQSSSEVIRLKGLANHMRAGTRFDPDPGSASSQGQFYTKDRSKPPV